MRADDDGFVNNPKKIQRMIGASDDDLKVLAAKKFIIPFESGVVVIKHWKIHNYIQSDRYKETAYLDEKGLLKVKENKAYTVCIQDVSKVETQDRDRLDKDSIGKVKNIFVPPTVEEVQAYITEKGYHISAEKFVDYYTANGWMVGKTKMKDWKAAVRNWERNLKDSVPKNTGISWLEVANDIGEKLGI